MGKKHGDLYWRYKKKTPPIDEFADKNGKVNIIKPAYKKTKEERKKWWTDLPSEKKSEYMSKWERKEKPRLEVPELTQEEIRQINQNMVDIGMERFIVLKEEGEILF